ncbi:MAG: hypothetical protein EXQ58_09630 [Acidobacteria bacterium]|nr:hypothetical protein [Acidobacteriota bacterium]
MKTLKRLLFLVLAFSIASFAHGQWSPIVAKQRRISYKIKADGSKAVTSEYTGTFFRSSDGSTLDTWFEVKDGRAQDGKASLIDTKTGRAYLILHDARVVRFDQDIPVPRLPRSKASIVIPEEYVKGRELINGIEAVAVGVRVNDKPVPGATWKSLAHDLVLKQDVRWSPTSGHYKDLYDVEVKEPDHSVFQFPAGYTINAPSP